MFPEWKTIAFQRSSCSANSPLAIVSRRGAPKKRFKDDLKKSLTTCNIDHKQWSDLAADRVAWRHTIHQAAAQFEADRRSSLKDKRQRRKARAASTTTPDITLVSLQILLAALSLPHRSGQPRACLQSTTTWTNLINLRSRSQAMMIALQVAEERPCETPLKLPLARVVLEGRGGGGGREGTAKKRMASFLLAYRVTDKP